MSTNYINKITDTGGTTHDIAEGVTTRIFRATCSTSSSTTAKVATLDDNTNYTLATGVRVAVTFTNGNSATSPTLNVNSSGAKNIIIPTSATTTTSGHGTTYNTWGPGETVLFTYNGTSWVSSGSALGLYNTYALAESKTSNTGTVTSIGISQGSGISVSGSPVTTSGSITVGHSNSVTAQTTEAVYPIKIDAQGHISAYGSAVSIPTKTSDLTNDSNFVSDASYVHTDNNYTTTEKDKLSGIASGAEVNVQADWNVTTTTSDAFIKNKPTIPSATSDLTNDSNFVADANYVHTDNNFTTTEKNKLSGIASGAEVNVQSDWDETSSSADSFIKNKPTIPTVPSSTGSATTGISISNHSTSSIYGVSSSTTSVTGVSGSTTASKVTLGEAISIPNVTSAGSAPTLSYTARTVGSASGWSAGSAASASYADGILTITNGVAPTLTVTNTSCDDITAWNAGSATTLGTAISVPNVSGVSDVTVPKAAASATTVPIKNTSATTIVTSATHSITDDGHSHSI